MEVVLSLPACSSPYFSSPSSISTLQYLNSLNSSETKPIQIPKTQFIKDQQISIRTLSLLLLSQTSLHDFDLIPNDDVGGRVSCSKKLLSLRWPSFNLRLKELEQEEEDGVDKRVQVVANGLAGNASPSSIIDDYAQSNSASPNIVRKKDSIRSYRIPLSHTATSIFVHWIYTLLLPPPSSSSSTSFPPLINSPTSPSFNNSKSARREPQIEIYASLLLFSTNENLFEFRDLVRGKLLELMESDRASREEIENLVQIAGLCGEEGNQIWLRGLTLLYENKFTATEVVDSSDSEVIMVTTEESISIPAILVPSLQSYSVHSFSRPSPPPSPLKNSFLPSPSTAVVTQSFSNPFSTASTTLTTPIVPRRNSKVLEYRRSSSSNFPRRGSLQDIFIESPPATPSSLYSGESSPASSGFSHGSGSGSLTVERKVVRGSMERLTRSWREEEELQAQQSQKNESEYKKGEKEDIDSVSNRDIPKIVVVDYRNSLLPALPASGSYSILDEDCSMDTVDSSNMPASPSRMSFSVNLKGIKKKLSLAVSGKHDRNGSISVAPPSPSPSLSRDSFFSQQQTIRPSNGYQSSTSRSNSSSILSNNSTGSLAERNTSGTGFSREKMPFGLN